MLSNSSRIMGLDFGTRRIGIALSDESRTIAQPYCVLQREGSKKDILRIMSIAREQRVSEIVVGLPYGEGPSMTAMGEKARKFASLLEAESGLRVSFIDESFTSVLAEEALFTGGLRGQRRKGQVDKIAASFILRDYLRKKAGEEK